jgi:hypothetical protein
MCVFAITKALRGCISPPPAAKYNNVLASVFLIFLEKSKKQTPKQNIFCVTGHEGSYDQLLRPRVPRPANSV